MTDSVKPWTRLERRVRLQASRHRGHDGDLVAVLQRGLVAVVGDLERQFPGMRDRLVDDGGEIRKFVNVYVNQEDVRFLDGDKTTLKDGDEVAIVPAMAGGL